MVRTERLRPGGLHRLEHTAMQLLMAYTKEEDTEAFFIFLDCEKAFDFDRRSWEYLSEAMRNL